MYARILPAAKWLAQRPGANRQAPSIDFYRRRDVIDLLQPLSQYFDYRINQLDVRLSKIFRTRGRKFQLNVDVYNAMNGSYALWTNNNYGTNGATWQRPTSTFDARLVKFGAQFDF